MRDRALIAVGIAVFVVAALSPFWLNAGRGASAAAPVLERPKGERLCVAPVEYMRASHMRLLSEWRDLAVRQNKRTWMAADGRTFTIGLTGTCLRCHDNKSTFCDRCHDYVGAAPACWDCHVVPARRTAMEQAFRSALHGPAAAVRRSEGQEGPR